MEHIFMQKRTRNSPNRCKRERDDRLITSVIFMDTNCLSTPLKSGKTASRKARLSPSRIVKLTAVNYTLLWADRKREYFEEIRRLCAGAASIHATDDCTNFLSSLGYSSCINNVVGVVNNVKGSQTYGQKLNWTNESSGHWYTRVM